MVKIVVKLCKVIANIIKNLIIHQPLFIGDCDKYHGSLIIREIN